MSDDDSRRDEGRQTRPDPLLEAPSPEGRALWRAARAGLLRDDGPTPAPERLAALLDGRLDDAERDALEAELAASAEGRALLVASREALTAGSDESVPRTLVARAQGLVRAAPQPAPARDAPWQRLTQRLFGALRPVGWVGAASLCLLLGVLSFELGAVGYRHVAASADRGASYELADEGSWQLFDVL